MPEEVGEDPQPGGKVNDVAVGVDEGVEVMGEHDNEADETRGDHDPGFDQIFCVGIFLNFQHVLKAKYFMEL